MRPKSCCTPSNLPVAMLLGAITAAAFLSGCGNGTGHRAHLQFHAATARGDNHPDAHAEYASLPHEHRLFQTTRIRSSSLPKHAPEVKI